jgi:hypothetical protein
MAQPEVFFSLGGKKSLDGDSSCKRPIWHIYSTIHFKEPKHIPRKGTPRPNFNIHVSVSDLYILTIVLFCCREHINRSQTHECGGLRSRNSQTVKNCSVLLQGFGTFTQPYTTKNQYRKFKTNIPRKGFARPQSQFTCVCERFVYSHDQSAYSVAGNVWTETDPGNI